MTESWTTLKVLTWTTGRFTERGLGSPRLDAEVLLAHVLGTTRVGLYTAFDQPLSEGELTRMRELIKRRTGGEPVAYLVGEQEFWSLALHVEPAVLIPRRDTETLVEVALREARHRTIHRLADVCTGSGAVALALATEVPTAEIWASDVSPDALAVARKNVERHKLEARVQLVQGDLCAPLAAGAPFDLIVSNPPYVRDAEIATLSTEVQREPRLALAGGADGLDLVRRLAPAARELLAPGGFLALEHGFDQASDVRELLAAAGFGEITTTRDLAGHERITAGRKSA